MPSRSSAAQRAPLSPPASEGAIVAPGTTNPDALLVRGLGTPQLTATIFNYTVGSGIFALPAVMVAQLGAAAVLPYLLCAFLFGLVGLVYAEAGSRVAATGGTYAYVEAGLGAWPGFVAGLLVLVTDAASVGAVVTLFAGTILRLLGATGPLWKPLLITGFIAGLALLNVRGLRHGARVVEAATTLKAIPLVFFVVVGAFFVHPSNLHWTGLPRVSSISAAAGMLVFAFGGIEAALQPSGEVRDPHRTVPRAIFLGLGAVTILYLAIQAVALGLLGPSLAADTVAPLAHAAGAFAGSAGRNLLLIAAVISTFGWLTGSMLASPRGLFALARDGFFPRSLAAVHPRFRTPHAAIWVYALVSAGLALTGTFERLVVLASIGMLGAYFLCALALFGLRRRNVQVGRPFRAPGGALLPWPPALSPAGSCPRRWAATTCWACWPSSSSPRDFISSAGCARGGRRAARCPQ